MTERSWRCNALGCRDYLTATQDADCGVVYLLFAWNQTPTLRERLRRLWRVLTGRPDDWYEYVVTDPAVARDIAAWLVAGADALEQEG